MRRCKDEKNRIAELVNLIENKKSELSQLVHEFYLRKQKKFKSKVFDQVMTDDWSIYQGDCVSVMKGLPTESIHYSIFSPPFLSLYVYSDDYRDMGNSKTDDVFYDHFEYCVSELYRLIMPGRLVSVHCSVVSMSIARDGTIGLKDLPGEIVRLFQKFGFIYHSKLMIWKDPLTQAVRTKALNLAHKQVVKDSSRCGQGFADEILTFRKPGVNLEPINNGKGFERYFGEDEEPKFKKNNDPKLNKYSQHVWQRYASPVWMDVKQTDTLNFAAARSENDERHIAPLQLQVIARCLELWTNEGDIVLSPFAGIGSEGYESIKLKRKFIGIELKESYYKQAVRNLKSADNRIKKLL